MTANRPERSLICQVQVLAVIGVAGRSVQGPHAPARSDVETPVRVSVTEVGDEPVVIGYLRLIRRADTQ